MDCRSGAGTDQCRTEQAGVSIPVSLREADMLLVLDRVVRENGLSYTECCFQKLESKTIKEKDKMITNESSPL